MHEAKDLREEGCSIGEMRQYEMSGMKNLALKVRRTKEETISRSKLSHEPEG